MTQSTNSTVSKTYAGLDVSLKETAVCIVDDGGKIVFESKVQSDPQLIANCLGKHGRHLERVGLESGMPRRPGCGASSASSACPSFVSTVDTRTACCR